MSDDRGPRFAPFSAAPSNCSCSPGRHVSQHSFAELQKHKRRSQSWRTATRIAHKRSSGSQDKLTGTITEGICDRLTLLLLSLLSSLFQTLAEFLLARVKLGGIGRGNVTNGWGTVVGGGGAEGAKGRECGGGAEHLGGLHVVVVLVLFFDSDDREG